MAKPQAIVRNGAPAGLLESLAGLRVSRCLLPEVGALLGAEVRVRDSRSGRVVGGREPDADASCCKPWKELGDGARAGPAVSWVACAAGGARHLTALLQGTSGRYGLLVSDAVAPVLAASGVHDVCARLLGVVAEEMSRYAEHRLALLAPAAAGELSEIVGVSAAIEEARVEVRRALAAPFPVLITGETGTGKDLAAWSIHHRGPRREGRYVVVNCAAMTETLLESTLFGHRKGAFTGAVRDEPGLLVAARGGTIFLDEVAELSPGAQAKLLRAIDSGEVLPVGATKPERTDARVIAATNADLEQAAHERPRQPAAAHGVEAGDAGADGVDGGFDGGGGGARMGNAPVTDRVWYELL